MDYLAERAKVNLMYEVAWSNDFIRRVPPVKLTEQEAKIVYYMASKIQPSDKNFRTITMRLDELCRTCGLDTRQGKNYSDLKNSLKKLSDKSAWYKGIFSGRRKEWLVRWIDTYEIEEGTGEIKATFSLGMEPFLLNLFERGHFTKSKLLNFMALKSKYSQRLYEILKSYTYSNTDMGYKEVEHIFDILELKKMLNAEQYGPFKDFRVRVLEIAEKQINEYTDINVKITPIKRGRLTTKIQFHIQLKQPIGRMVADKAAEDLLDVERKRRRSLLMANDLDGAQVLDGQFSLEDIQ